MKGEAYDNFVKKATKKNWTLLSEQRVKSYIIYSYETWYDRENQESYILEIIQDGSLMLYKLQEEDLDLL